VAKEMSGVQDIESHIGVMVVKLEEMGDSLRNSNLSVTVDLIVRLQNHRPADVIWRSGS